MADDEQLNDEYQYAELDPMNPDEGQNPHDAEVTERENIPEESNVKRNAIIAIVVFLVLMLCYKFIGSYFIHKMAGDSDIKPVATTPASTVAAPTLPTPVIVEPSTVVTTSPPDETSAGGNSEILSKLTSISSAQDSLHSEVSNLNGQVGTITSNLDALSQKISELNRIISNLSDKLEVQAQIIEHLSVKPVVKAPRYKTKVYKQSLQYYVQAVIPGRAWLVASNGSTLTVREGSTIPGYGIVKLIDPNQGRIITSSGRVIRFNQDDS